MKRIAIGLMCIVVATAVCLCWKWIPFLLSKPLVVIGLLAVVGYLLYDQSEKWRALGHMRGRSPLEAKEFGARYFPPSQADIAAQVRTILADHIRVDVSRVHPDDKLVEELRMDALDSMSTVEFLVALEEHFKIEIPDSAAERMRTIRDITEVISELKFPQAKTP